MGKPGKANPENLIRLGDRSPEELKRICSMGGKASGVAKRKAKTLKEAAKAIGEELIQDKNGDSVTKNYAIVMQLYNLALKGNKDAVRFIAKLLGEFADTEQTNTLVNQTVTLKID